MKKLFLFLCLAVGGLVSAFAASGTFAAISHEGLQQTGRENTEP